MSIDKTHHDPGRKDLIKGYVVEAFRGFFGEAKNKKKILQFIREQLESKSPRTKKKAEEFLKKWDKD